MKILLVTAMLAMATLAQAGDGKACDKTCDAKATAKCGSCGTQSACCAKKVKVAHSPKGADLLAKR